MGNIWNAENTGTNGKRKLSNYEKQMLNDTIIAGNDEEAKKWIEAMEDINQEVYGSETLLTRCCIFGRIELIKHLIALGADVNKLDEDGNSALMYAVEYGHIEVILEAGENINYVNKHDGNSALSWSVRYNKLEIFELLLSSGVEIEKCGGKALLIAFQNENISVVETLIELGANVNYISLINGNTSLHWACLKNNFKLVKLSLNNGVDETIKNHEGKTAIQLATNLEIKEFINDFKPSQFILK